VKEGEEDQVEPLLMEYRNVVPPGARAMLGTETVIVPSFTPGHEGFDEVALAVGT